MLVDAATDTAALLAAGHFTPDLARRAGRLGIPIPDAGPDGYGLNPAEILDGLSDLADYDPAAAIGPDGSVLPMHTWPPSLRRALASLTVETNAGGVGTITRLKFAPRTPAYALLARFRGMEPKSKAEEIVEDLAALVRDARERARVERTASPAPALTAVDITPAAPSLPDDATPDADG
jgi:hypothetical protein